MYYWSSISPQEIPPVCVVERAKSRLYSPLPCCVRKAVALKRCSAIFRPRYIGKQQWGYNILFPHSLVHLIFWHSRKWDFLWMFLCSLGLWWLVVKTCAISFVSLVHAYKSMNPQTERVMEFYTETRVDGLQKLAENASEMKEYFMGRDDFKYFQHTEFRTKRKKVTLAGVGTDVNSRPIVVRPRQEQKSICHSDIYTLQNMLPEALGSFLLDTTKAKLQMKHPSLVQLLCLSIACLTQPQCVH